MPQDLIGCRNQRKLKVLFPRVVDFANDQPLRREGSIFLYFLLFYGLIVGKYALICAMEIQKIQVVVHIFSGFALFTELMWQLMWLYRRVESLFKLFTANNVPFHLPTNECKSKYLVSFESLAGNDFSERGTQAEAHCERNLNRQLWSKYGIAVQGIFVGIIIKATWRYS